MKSPFVPPAVGRAGAHCQDGATWGFLPAPAPPPGSASPPFAQPRVNDPPHAVAATSSHPAWWQRQQSRGSLAQAAREGLRLPALGPSPVPQQPDKSGCGQHPLPSAAWAESGQTMATVNLRALTSWVGIARLLAVVLSCLAFSLVASTGHFGGPYGTWCMFTWCFCFTVTLLVLLLELLELYPLLPLSWDDFTSAFSMLATLMVFTSSVVFPATLISSPCSSSQCARQAVATTASCLCFLAYAVEVSLTRAKPGDISSFLSTVPGLLKVFEAYVACLIFSLLDNREYSREPGLMWCVAVYSICFIFTLLIIIFTIGRCLTYIPCPLEKVLVGYNFLALLMYLTATILWPLYSFQGRSRPDSCDANCWWNKNLGVTFLTIFNLIAYLVDLVYSTRMVFFRAPP
ncbi:LOW QUALITY PROTEIN: myeloid-associated differentiation marker homolog [Vidua macroura]|uniref:LOW QUALITY PROTEIN: myeloid-associated differentiation marker homolog n=1 Tax=Vidua macroura TaxID=187451 RepID=UPI0023A87392|nr:LOW QUALITY PROTEIN: myeloid-associated differentiation marker homolog [Vidua macroura]